jgi:MerR family mercuric resistance operon transcriptional regulator
MQEVAMARPNTNPRAQAVTIGMLSERTGVNIETIRYYERIGLLPAPPRSEGRRRLYDDGHRRHLTFIRRSRELGFSLGQTRELLGLDRGHGLSCGEVKALTEQHIADVRHKISDLRRLERVLSELAAQCSNGAVPDCPILDALGSKG